MDPAKLQKLLEDIAPLLTTYAIRIVGVVLLGLVAWVVSGWVASLITAALERGKADATISRFLGSAVRSVVLIVAGIACLGVFGVETTSFAAVLGAAGLAIGLAFQGSLSNLASGVMLLMFRPFKAGDVISVSGVTGGVTAIELFATTLDTPDNRRFILPNSAVFGSTVENMTFHAYRRVDVAVGTDYGADLKKTREVLMKATEGVGHVPDGGDAQVYLLELGDSSISWAVRVWCKPADYWAVREVCTEKTKVLLDEAGIGIPFPQMDVHLDKVA